MAVAGLRGRVYSPPTDPRYFSSPRLVVTPVTYLLHDADYSYRQEAAEFGMGLL